jgi:phosphatidylglycerol:prolipoprotein diacylglycerol transferase
LLDAIYHALDPVAFWIGPFAIRWYGLGYIVGVLAGGLLISHIAKRWNIRFTVDALLTLYIAAMLGIVVGGRAGYILIYGAGYYFENPGEILTTSMAGMSFHGGVIGMVIAMLIVSRLFKMPFAALADLVVIAAPIGIFLVRCANFINGELWGAPTDLPWGVTFEGGGGIPRHPSQLYEALLEGIVLFIVLQILARKKPPLARGYYLSVFLMLYGVFRIAVEFVRVPDEQLGYLAGGWLTMGMSLSIVMVLAGLGCLIYAIKTKHPQVGLPEPPAV